MIAHASDLQRAATRTPTTSFEDLLPRIVNLLRYEFRRLTSEPKDEAVQEGVANAYVAYRRLVDLGREALVYPSALARYAARQVRAGRKVGGRLNSADVSSPYAQRRQGLRLLRLDHFDREQQAWRDAVINDPRTPVFHQVWFRIDFPAWLGQLSQRSRQIALALANGERTQDVARAFDLSPARIAQMRRELEASWRQFHQLKHDAAGRFAA